MSKVRKNVRILLLNPENKLLLIRADDPNTTNIDGIHRGPFWFTVGGGIEDNESMHETAMREIFEETGLEAKHINLGPLVWTHEFKILIKKQPVHMQSHFFLARSSTSDVHMENMTAGETSVITELRWFNLAELKNWHETIFPLQLVEHIPALLKGKIPEKMINFED